MIKFSNSSVHGPIARGTYHVFIDGNRTGRVYRTADGWEFFASNGTGTGRTRIDAVQAYLSCRDSEAISTQEKETIVDNYTITVTFPPFGAPYAEMFRGTGYVCGCSYIVRESDREFHDTSFCPLTATESLCPYCDGRLYSDGSCKCSDGDAPNAGSAS